MCRKKFLLVIVLVAALGVLTDTVSLANDGRAVVVDDFGCSGWAATTTGNYWLHTTDSHALKTPSGNIQLTCHFDASL